MDRFDFTAIDFETMTAEHTSACAIGIVRVENCVITQKFYSLIKPVPDDRTSTNTHVHGLTPEMVENAPTFGELWPSVSHFFRGQTLVCHNISFDMSVLCQSALHYGIKLNYDHCEDTMAFTNKGLAESCKEAHISLDSHHDALCDAVGCAELMLSQFGVIHFKPAAGMKEVLKNRETRTVSSDTKRPLSEDEVTNRDTPFFGKKVVITGVLSAFPYREDLASLLKEYGADINTSISTKTNIVIVGEGAGPSKMGKIAALKMNGYDVQLLYEPDLMEILEKYNML